MAFFYKENWTMINTEVCKAVCSYLNRSTDWFSLLKHALSLSCEIRQQWLVYEDLGQHSEYLTGK